MLRFLKTTIIGGIVFLVPIVILVAVIGKALGLASKLATPLAGLLPIKSIVGLAAVELLAIIILILICFLAGLAAKTARARRFINSLESNILSNIPAYEFFKSRVHVFVPTDDAEGLKPVLARFDDSWQIAFEVERIEGGQVTIFLPGAPDPWSGSVCFMTEDRIKPLDITLLSAVNTLKGLGKGAKDQLDAYT
jgi:uncharacterized membrane protein